ncbi:MAG TPA: hypothetical protein VGD65_18070 [Chryseosolibacter sp.]
MFTFNFKVLLKHANRAFGLSTLVWFATSVIGTVALAPTEVIGLPFYQILILSLAFSTPSFLVITPSLWIQPAFPTRFSKFLYTISVALLACLAVVLFFLFVTKGYPLDKNLKIFILMPYALTALIIVPLAMYHFTKSHNKTNP